MHKFKYGSQINPPQGENENNNENNNEIKKNDITIETFNILNNEDPNIPENHWELKLSQKEFEKGVKFKLWQKNCGSTVHSIRVDMKLKNICF